MDRKLDPSEIVNPKKTLDRRGSEAGLSADSAPVGGLIPSTERGKSQADFLYKPASKKGTPADAERKRKNFIELQRKRDRELTSANDQFEDEFSSGSDAPLTDSVRAARKMAAGPAIQEDAEYASAYDEEQKSAA
jgi:hypothetical protein